MSIKTCYKCGETKQSDLFTKNKNLCKLCNNEKYKKYYNENKAKVLKMKQEYREDNEEKIKERRRQKYNCVCGSIIRKEDETLHEQSNKHINFINGVEKEVTVLVSYYNEEKKKKNIKLSVDKFKELEKERQKLMRTNYVILKVLHFI